VARNVRTLTDFKHNPKLGQRFPSPVVGSPFEIGQDPRPEILIEIKELQKLRERAESEFYRFLNTSDKQRSRIGSELSELNKRRDSTALRVKELYADVGTILDKKIRLESGLDKYSVSYFQIIFLQARQIFDSAYTRLREAKNAELSVAEKQTIVDDVLNQLAGFREKLDTKESGLKLREVHLQTEEESVAKRQGELDKKEQQIEVVLADTKHNSELSVLKLRQAEERYGAESEMIQEEKSKLEVLRQSLDLKANVLNARDFQQERREQALNDKDVVLKDRQETLGRVAEELRNRADNGQEVVQ
jgi:hypothetical protein